MVKSLDDMTGTGSGTAPANLWHAMTLGIIGHARVRAKSWAMATKGCGHWVRPEEQPKRTGFRSRKLAFGKRRVVIGRAR